MPHIPGCCRNVPDDQWKDKMEYEIYYMQILDVLFEQFSKHTGERLVDKWFEPITEYETR